MKYYEVFFSIDAPEELMQDVRDTVAAMAGEAAFESFVDAEGGMKGYVQQQLFDRSQLEEVLSFVPFEGISISFSMKEAEDRDWNEQWEQEGFDPIVVAAAGAGKPVVIHDGRHLPATTQDDSILIEIDARLAFGTGSHETTRLMVAALSEWEPAGKCILDCGTGTGILGIAALKMGAARCVAYDIDEWSADNARHNAVINGVDDHFTSLLGDATLLDSITENFDVVLANINRNILLSDMPRFRAKMHDDSVLLLSGFYEDDIPLLAAKAQILGLQLADSRSDAGWACIALKPQLTRCSS